MGERKVLNKYIPADFDPRLVPRGKKSKDDLIPVRMMLPFSIQCSTCSSFMYRGKKFNSKKEPVKGPEGKYLGIQRFRFYIKCSVCSRPVTFTTDPKNADYEMETGATRNYEVWHDKAKTNEEIAADREAEEKVDPMRALENRVLDSQREMADLDNLDEIKAMNMRHVKMLSSGGAAGGDGSAGGGGFQTVEAVLKAREGGQKRGEEDQEGEELNEHGLTAGEEEMVKSIKFGNSGGGGASPKGDIGDGDSSVARGNTMTIRRLDEEDEKELELRRRREEAELERLQRQVLISGKSDGGEPKNLSNGPVIVPVIRVKRKRPASSASVGNKKAIKNAEGGVTKKSPPAAVPDVDPNNDEESSPDGGGLGGLLGGYGSDSDSD